MERIKDILFDLSDFLISLVIVAAIFFVVSWKLSETMPMSFSLFQASDKTATVTEAPHVSQPEAVVIQETTAAEDNIVEATAASNETEIQTTAAEVAPANESNAIASNNTSKPVKRITIDIPSGSTGDAIAKILRNSGLINDIPAFNRTVEALGLGNKLRAGSVTLSTDMSLETLARRIAGYKN